MLVIQSKKQIILQKLKGITNKYFTISIFNKFTENIHDTKITAKYLLNDSGLNEKIKTLAAKGEIKNQQQRQN